MRMPETDWWEGLLLRSSPKDEARKAVRDARADRRWLRRTERRLWLLRTAFRGRPVRVHEWHVPSLGDAELELPEAERGAGWLDVQIEMPPLPGDVPSSAADIVRWYREFRSLPKRLRDHLPGFHCRWVFTVEGRRAWLDMSPSDAHAMLYCGRPEFHTPEFLERLDDLGGFHRWIGAHLHEAMLGPVVEYDDVFTAQDRFSREDVFKYTKLWLERWHPGLAARPVEWKDGG
jgi:hypothetical protein